MFYKRKHVVQLFMLVKKHVFNNVKLKNMFLQANTCFQLFRLVKNMFLNQKHIFTSTIKLRCLQSLQKHVFQHKNMFLNLVPKQHFMHIEKHVFERKNIFSRGMTPARRRESNSQTWQTCFSMKLPKHVFECSQIEEVSKSVQIDVFFW